MFNKRNVILGLIIILILTMLAAAWFLPAKEQIRVRNNPPSVASSAAEPAPTTPPTGKTKGESISPNFRIETQIQPIPPAPVTQPVSRTVRLEIKGNTELAFKVNWVSGMTVWDVLDKASKDNGFEVKGAWNNVLKSYYVTGIAGTNCECWKYSVNGVEPPKGSSLVAVSENDIIIWKKI